jgi:hypothetical protein
MTGVLLCTVWSVVINGRISQISCVKRQNRPAPVGNRLTLNISDLECYVCIWCSNPICAFPKGRLHAWDVSQGQQVLLLGTPHLQMLLIVKLNPQRSSINNGQNIVPQPHGWSLTGMQDTKYPLTSSVRRSIWPPDPPLVLTSPP